MIQSSWDSWVQWKAGNPNWATFFRGDYWHPITPTTSIANVQGSGGNLYWRDTANNLIWLLVRSGGLPSGDPTPNSDDDLYRTTTFVIDNTL